MDPLFEFALAVKAIYRELDRGMNEALRPLGLTGPQADALYVIGQAGPLSLRDLGELLIAEAGHPSRLVDRLVEAGLVQRRTSGEDRRRVLLSLTARGRRLERRVRDTRRDVMQLGRDMVGDLDLDPALKVLRELVRATSYGDLERSSTPVASPSFSSSSRSF
jgi:DNA-binding MarR family transcriptional regulator